VKVGDLVKYAAFPHKELSESSLVGLVVEIETFLFLEKAHVRWNSPRPQGEKLLWEYIDELEVINEAR
jgi:hypothetical protein